jgi:hypothetical protein
MLQVPALMARLPETLTPSPKSAPSAPAPPPPTPIATRSVNPSMLKSARMCETVSSVLPEAFIAGSSSDPLGIVAA